MEQLLLSLFNTFNIKIAGFTISPNYFTAIVLIILIFLLIFSLARMHRLFVHWSFKGGVIGVLIGFILALVIEGFFIVGGSTILTSFFGWKNAPKPIARVLDASRAKLQGSLCEDNSQSTEEEVDIVEE